MALTKSTESTSARISNKNSAPFVSVDNFYLPGISMDRKRRHLSCDPLPSEYIGWAFVEQVIPSYQKVERLNDHSKVLFSTGVSLTPMSPAIRYQLTKCTSGNSRFMGHQCLQITSTSEHNAERPGPQLMDPTQ